MSSDPLRSTGLQSRRCPRLVCGIAPPAFRSRSTDATGRSWPACPRACPTSTAVHVHARRRAAVRDAPAADRGVGRHDPRRAPRRSSRSLLRHPGDAKVTTTEPSLGTAGNYELWISDGETVRTYSAAHKLGHGATGPAHRRRPRRPRPARACRAVYRPADGAADGDAARTRSSTPPATARTCWRPGAAGSSGTDGRSPDARRSSLECDHPRTIEIGGRPARLPHPGRGRPRRPGVILRLVETIGGGGDPRRRGRRLRARRAAAAVGLRRSRSRPGRPLMY